MFFLALFSYLPALTTQCFKRSNSLRQKYYLSYKILGIPLISDSLFFQLKKIFTVYKTIFLNHFFIWNYYFFYPPNCFLIQVKILCQFMYRYKKVLVLRYSKYFCVRHKLMVTISNCVISLDGYVVNYNVLSRILPLTHDVVTKGR